MQEGDLLEPKRCTTSCLGRKVEKTSWGQDGILTALRIKLPDKLLDSLSIPLKALLTFRALRFFRDTEVSIAIKSLGNIVIFQQ